MSRFRYDKIPIWENKQRIKDLTFFRDLYLEGLVNPPKITISPTTGKPFTGEECHRSVQNRPVIIDSKPATFMVIRGVEEGWQAVSDWLG